VDKPQPSTSQLRTQSFERVSDTSENESDETDKRREHPFRQDLFQKPHLACPRFIVLDALVVFATDAHEGGDVEVVGSTLFSVVDFRGLRGSFFLGQNPCRGLLYPEYDVPLVKCILKHILVPNAHPSGFVKPHLADGLLLQTFLPQFRVGAHLLSPLLGDGGEASALQGLGGAAKGLAAGDHVSGDV
jgi:hypothetical protein